MDLRSLNKKHREIVYADFSWNLELMPDLTFRYFIPPDFSFTTTISIRFPPKVKLVPLSTNLMNNLVFHIGLIELFNYWKLVCAPVIRIKVAILSEPQKDWWNKLLINGMGEYFYKNGVDFTKSGFIRWETESPHVFHPDRITMQESFLVLTSGGKDSLLTRRILQEQQKPVILFHEETLIGKGIIPPPKEDIIVAYRKLDPEMTELNKQGYLNGHVPYSAYLGFLSLLISALTKSRYIVVANEKSADETNVKYLGQAINHQYSKTFRFESDFRDYVDKFLTQDVSYFSLLRPLYEIQIAKLFSQNPEDVTKFTSCNHYKSSGRWCGECPKCLSIYLLLAPFTEVTSMIQIFGANLLEKETLIPLYASMVDPTKTKPFECIATYAESQVASFLLMKKILKSGSKLPVLLDYFKLHIFPKHQEWDTRTDALLHQFDERNFLPKDLKDAVKTKVFHANR